eukprot:g11086.t1
MPLKKLLDIGKKYSIIIRVQNQRAVTLSGDQQHADMVLTSLGVCACRCLASPPSSSSSSSWSPSRSSNKKDGPYLAAFRVLLGERGVDQNSRTRCSRWLSSAKELRLVSFDLCNACRGTLPVRVWVGQNTPESLWAAAAPPPPAAAPAPQHQHQQQKDGNDGGGGALRAGEPVSCVNSGNSSSNATPKPPACPRKRALWGVLATTVVWDRPARDIASAGKLLEYVERLRFGFHFNEPLVSIKMPRFPWPDSLVSLDTGVKFQQDLSGASLPAGLLELRFGGAFNCCIRRIVWPPRLRKLCFGPGFNQPIAGVTWPDSLQHLSFGDSFDQPLLHDSRAVDGSVSWPPHLVSLTFGAAFSQNFRERGGGDDFRSPLPTSLKQLTLSEGFRQLLDAVAWPSCLEELRLQCVYVGVASEGLPTGLKKLHLDLSFDQSIRGVVPLLPEMLQELRFGDHFNERLDGVEWPHGLKKLALGDSFNRPIEEGHASFPPQLERLEFGSRFNQSIATVVWPKSLRELVFSDSFNHPVSAVSWPEKLQALQLGRAFDQPLPTSWPRKLSRLRVGKNFRQPGRGLSLPPSLVLLELGEGCQQPLEGVKWPSRLKMITVGVGRAAALTDRVRGLGLPDGCRIRHT